MLCRLLIILITVYVLPFGKGHSQPEERPNILFLIADDWSYGHAGAYGDPLVRTPNIDSVAREGAVFYNAFTAAPSCTPSRAAILTGKFPHELEAGASLWGYLPKKYDNYTLILERGGYHVGMSGKGWGPGKFQPGGYDHNPAGKTFKDFASFMQERPEGKPFSFWFGSQNPHRPYVAGSGAASGMTPDLVKVPEWLPDVAEVRNDILDYYFEVEAFDRQVGEIITLLKKMGEYENTLIIITGDNGMPFPRAKATLYDAGTRIPLIITMRGNIAPKKVTELVSLTDVAPTILHAAREKIPGGMTGESLWGLLTSHDAQKRDAVFVELERHANVRNAELGYPSRAVRTENFLYIRNYEPGRWPAGDPVLYHSVGPYGDVDASPSKEYIISNRANADVKRYFDLSFGKRPAEELYDLKSDPGQMNNVADDKKYNKTISALRKRMDAWQQETADPRLTREGARFEKYPYFGPPVKGAPSTYKPDDH